MTTFSERIFVLANHIANAVTISERELGTVFLGSDFAVCEHTHLLIGFIHEELNEWEVLRLKSQLSEEDWLAADRFRRRNKEAKTHVGMVAFELQEARLLLEEARASRRPKIAKEEHTQIWRSGVLNEANHTHRSMVTCG